MIEADGAIRTDQMSLAAVLSMHGYDLIMSKDGPTVFWCIPEAEADELAHELVDEYVSGACRVEPRNFMREVREVRGRLYDYLGVRGTSRRSVRGSVPGHDHRPVDDATSQR